MVAQNMNNGKVFDLDWVQPSKGDARILRYLALMLTTVAAMAIVLAFGAIAGNAPQALAVQPQDLSAADASSLAAQSSDDASLLFAQDDEVLYDNGIDTYEHGRETVMMSGKISGDVLFSLEEGVLRLSNVKATEGGIVKVVLDGRYLIVELVGDNENVSISSNVPLKIKGSGTLKGNISTSTDSRADVFVTGGTITGEIIAGRAFDMSGGKIVGSVAAYDGYAKLTGGTIQGVLSTTGMLTMAGGAITCTGENPYGWTYPVVCGRGLDMQKGTINLKNAGGIKIRETLGESNNLTMAGGKISVVGSSPGVLIEGGNLVMTGGTLAVTGASGDAIWLTNTTDNSMQYGGKVKITGGTLKATVKDVQNNFAVYAASMTNKTGCLKSVAGRLPVGAQFAIANNQYKTTSSTSVKLLKYGANAKEVTLDHVSFGKRSYAIMGIGAGAFTTAAGRNVTSVVVVNDLEEIGAKAFAKTKALVKLQFKYPRWIEYVRDANYRLKSMKVASGHTVSAKAFTKCGKGGGKKLTVIMYETGIWKTEVPVHRTFFASIGLSTSAQFKTT